MNLHKEFDIRMAEFEEDIQNIAILANEIWHEYFPFILSEEQIIYMIDKFQSSNAMKNQIQQEGYVYYKLLEEKRLIGYFAIREDKDDRSLFLSKLYLHKSSRGKGYGTTVFQYLKEFCLNNNYNKIWLTVNKYNEGTINAYIKRGFIQTDTRVLDIGNGYIMDDYIMEWMITA
ncbi:MAG: putative acetyltransferase [Anaerocolumna sp.]|jgi:RimJ/RimL family protein N-acetyltransferase|nr:putative acetyltransferase [Anaerocolumna sp.]